MIKISNNIVIGFSVLIGLANTLYIYKFFGTSIEADAYFISMIVLTTFFLIYQMLSEQYLIVVRAYHDRKKRFNVIFSSYFKFVFLLGLIFTVFLFLSLFLFKGFFVFSERFIVLTDYLEILFLLLFFYTPFQVLLSTLIALGKIKVSNVFDIIPRLFILLLFVFSYALGFSISLNNVAEVYVLGFALSFFIMFFYVVRKIGFPKVFLKNKSYDILKKSLKMKSVNNIHNVYLGFGIAFATSYYPPGYSSLFFYAKRVSDTALNVLYMPTHQIVVNKVVDFYRNKSFKEIILLLNKVSAFFPFAFFFCFSLCYFLLPYFFDFFSIEIEAENFDLVIALLFFLFVANCLVSSEVGYSIVNQIEINFRVILVANLGFIILSILTWFIANLFDKTIVNVALAIAVGQVSNFFINRYIALKRLNFLMRNSCV